MSQEFTSPSLRAEGGWRHDLVLKNHYVTERDEEFRQKSNRTFQRLLAELPPDVLQRFGYIEVANNLESKLAKALATKDWPLAAALTTQLAKQQHPAIG